MRAKTPHMPNTKRCHHFTGLHVVVGANLVTCLNGPIRFHHARTDQRVLLETVVLALSTGCRLQFAKPILTVWIQLLGRRERSAAMQTGGCAGEL